MKQTDVKKVKIYPKQGACGIPDILPANKMIEKETELDLNTSEIIRAMNYAPTTTMIDGEEVPLTPINFDETSPEDTGGLTKETLEETKTSVLLNIENLITYHNTISGTKDQANPVILNMVTEYNTLNSLLSEKGLNNMDSFIEYKKHLYSMISFLIYEIDHTDIKSVTGDTLEWDPVNYSDYTKIVTNFSSFKSIFIEELTAFKEEIENLSIPKWKEEQAKEDVDISEVFSKAEKIAGYFLVSTTAHLCSSRLDFQITNLTELLKYYSDQYFNISNATTVMSVLIDTYPMVMECIRGIFTANDGLIKNNGGIEIAQAFKTFYQSHKEKYTAMFKVYYDDEDPDTFHAFTNHVASDCKRRFTTTYKIHHFSSYPINCDIEFLQDLLEIFKSCKKMSHLNASSIIDIFQKNAKVIYNNRCEEFKVVPSTLISKQAEDAEDYTLGSAVQSKVQAIHYPDVGQSITKSLLSQSGNSPSGNNGGITMLLDHFKVIATPSRYIEDNKDNKDNLRLSRNTIKIYFNQVWIYNIVDASSSNDDILDNKDFYAVWSAFQASSGLMYDKLGFRSKEGTINFPNSGHVEPTLPLNEHDKAEANQIANLLKHLLNNMENDYGIVWYDREFS